METTRFVATENGFEPINSEEFEAGYHQHHKEPVNICNCPQALSLTLAAAVWSASILAPVVFLYVYVGSRQNSDNIAR